MDIGGILSHLFEHKNNYQTLESDKHVQWNTTNGFVSFKQSHNPSKNFSVGIL